MAVTDAWQSKPSQQSAEAQSLTGATTQPYAAATGDVIATVDDQPINRQEVVRLLLAGRGVGVIDELILLELAKRKAAAANIEVTAADIQTELDRSLAGLLNTLPVDDPTSFDHSKAREVLDAILAQRGMSWDEYRAGMERKAYLRKICESTITVSEDQLQQEYAMAGGERVRIRHIQIAQPAEASRIRRELNAGIDFVELVDKFSANPVTAAAGGLLRPFSANDPLIPPALREAAFRLPVGEVSTPIQVEGWHHFVRVEERIAAESFSFEQAQPELHRRVTDRLVEEQMPRLAQELYRQSIVRIHDPIVKEHYEKAHPDKARR